jgi:hypothetical protein
MEIRGTTTYKDGGTVSIHTDEGEFCIDRRVNTKTEGVIYLGHPNDDNQNRVRNQAEIKKQLLKAMEKFIIKNSSHYSIIESLEKV